MRACRPATTITLLDTWNVRVFGGLTAKWDSGSSDSPRRNLTDICLAEVVRRFDVCAIQETRGKLDRDADAAAAARAELERDLTDAGLGTPPKTSARLRL